MSRLLWERSDDLTTLAYSHTLVAGTPENINDVQDMFNDAKTVINGNLDTSNMAATMKPATLMGPYRPVSEATMAFTSLTGGAATYTPTASGGSVPIGTSATLNLLTIPIVLADYAVSGLTTQFRIQASTITNTIAPAINFTFGVFQLVTTGGAGGNTSIVSGGPVLGGVTRAAPAASSPFTDTGADFTISSNGVYVLCVTTTGTPTVNSNTMPTIRLQVHNI